jgi:hypothetical protein
MHFEEDAMTDFEHDDDPTPVEGYCVRCKTTVEMEEVQAVWTRRGMPAARGECPLCGGTVFRMGRTDAHSGQARPDAVQVGAATRARLPRDAAYINYAPADEALAQQLGADLEKAGVAVWLHEADQTEVNWAGGVHPSLAACRYMVLVLSPAALRDHSVGGALESFRAQRKPVVIAQADPADPPDAVRRSPRFDFAADYRAAFRQLVQALNG